jgi:hypothetical protein
MRVLVCGGRAYTDRDELYAELDGLHAEYVFTTIIAGGAGGADALALGRRRAASRRKLSERNGERLAAQGERVRFAMRAYWRKADRIS